MTVGDVHTLMVAWAPKEIAWERDNIGLQVGDMNATVSSILVCLDVTDDVIRQAKQRKANLIISHHPLLFRPPKSITAADATGRCIRALVLNNINLYAAHTNLDFTEGGTSFAIADALGLEEVEFLHRSYHIQKKIVTFVPREHAGTVSNAMAAAGAGKIGNYDHCSFETAGTGSFRGNTLARPRTGKKGRLEQVAEVKLEMIVNDWDTSNVVSAMRSAHPYEEVAYDVIPLENISSNYGMGIIGTFKRPMRTRQFIELVKKKLRSRTLRHTTSATATIQRVAACGGSGAELTNAAIARGADAFITADIKYHDFHDATGSILLVDAGHYETEHLVIKAVVTKLKKEFSAIGTRVPIASTTLSTNPVLYS